jgi:uncharacterized protein YnzC (UPF0291/DUF896 family)
MDVGYELPFSNVTLPSIPQTCEQLGFDTNLEEEVQTAPGTEQDALNNDSDDDDDDADAAANTEDIDRAVTDEVDSLFLGFQSVLSREISKRTSTFDAFFKLTGGRPVVPFNLKGEDIVSKEEIRLFKQMSPEYSRTAAPSKKNVGYNSFMTEWDTIAGQRRTDYLLDDSVIPIYGKSLRMLQQLADTLKAQQLAAVEATEQAKRRADGLKQMFRDVRRNVAPPSIAVAEPERYHMQDPREVPTGAPFILNPTAAMARVGRKRDENAPFAVPVTKRLRLDGINDKKPAAKILPKGVTFNMICKNCGRKKSEHGGYGFGSRCGYQYCARCGVDKTYHLFINSPMGYFCKNSSIPAWRNKQYEEMVRACAKK